MAVEQFIAGESSLKESAMRTMRVRHATALAFPILLLGLSAANAQDAASRGHSGKAMGAINTLSNTNTGVLAPASSGRSSDKK